MLQKNHLKTIKIFLKKKKPKTASMPVIDTEVFLWKMNLVKKKKQKRQYARDVYNNLSGENNAKGVNMHMKNIETF